MAALIPLDIHLEAVDGRIWMAAPLRGDLPDRAAAIMGQGIGKTPKHRAWAGSVLRSGLPPKFIWTYPLNLRTCLDIRREFADEKITIHPKLWEWAEREQARREDLRKILALDRHPTTRIAAQYPKLNAAIHHRPFQTVGVAYAVRARNSVNADEPGLGKTLQAMGAAIEADLKGPILVLAPSVAVTSTWPDEFDEWVPGEEYVVCEGSTPEREEILQGFWAWARGRRDKRSWIFCNLEMLQAERPPVRKRKTKEFTQEEWDATAAEREAEYQKAVEEYDPDKRRHPSLFGALWSAVIIDEAQRVLPTKASVAAKQSQMRSGAQSLVVRPNGMKLALSGTPMRGSPLNFWGIQNWLWPVQFSGFWTYVDRWFDVIDGDNGRLVEGIRADVEEDYGAELDAVMIRRTKAEVAPWLPSKVYGGHRLVPSDRQSPVGVWLDMEPRQRAAYDQMVADAVALLESGELMANGILAEMIRCKQMASAFGDVEHILKAASGTGVQEWADRYRPKLPSNKWTWLHEFLTERGISNPRDAWGSNKVVVGSWQTALLELFAAELKRLKVPHFLLTGKTKGDDRAAMRRTFQGVGGPRVFLLNTFAGGVSLTLDAADDMVVLDETWGPDDQTQLEDRIHRISRGSDRPPPMYWYLRSRGTIEEHIARTTEGKDQIQRRLLDGRRGVETAKLLLTGG